MLSELNASHVRRNRLELAPYIERSIGFSTPDARGVASEINRAIGSEALLAFA